MNNILREEHWTINKLVHCKKEAVQINNNKIQIKLDYQGYSCVSLLAEKHAIRQNAIYEFQYNYFEEGTEHKILFTFLDQEGIHLSRGYLKGGETFISPPGACNLEIGLIVYSRSLGNFNLTSLDIQYISDYQERLVTLGAVAIDYEENQTYEKNMTESLRRIDELAKEKPDLILLTEGFYDRRVECTLEEGSITIDSEPIKRLMEKAKTYHTYIAGSIHEVSHGNYYNTAFLIDRGGHLVATYRKTHLTLSEYEIGMIPGDEIPVFETDFGKVGIAICWDLFFPEMVRMLHIKGAEMILNPTAGFESARTETRAKESGAFILTSAVDYREQTRITDPLGNTLDDAKEKGYAVATVDLNKQYYVYWLSCPSHTTGKNIFLHERRADLYFNG